MEQPLTRNLTASGELVGIGINFPSPPRDTAESIISHTFDIDYYYDVNENRQMADEKLTSEKALFFWLLFK